MFPRGEKLFQNKGDPFPYKSCANVDVFIWAERIENTQNTLKYCVFPSGFSVLIVLMSFHRHLLPEYMIPFVFCIRAVKFYVLKVFLLLFVCTLWNVMLRIKAYVSTHMEYSLVCCSNIRYRCNFC